MVWFSKKTTPPGARETAAFFKTLRPVKRAKVPGRANDEVEKIIGITPALFTCYKKEIFKYKFSMSLFKDVALNF